GLPACDGGAAECFDGVVESVTGLLAQNLAEEHAQGADVAAKRRFLQFTGRGLQLREPLRPVGWSPEGRHSLIMHRRAHLNPAPVWRTACGAIKSCGPTKRLSPDLFKQWHRAGS